MDVVHIQANVLESLIDSLLQNCHFDGHSMLQAFKLYRNRNPYYTGHKVYADTSFPYQ